MSVCVCVYFLQHAAAPSTARWAPSAALRCPWSTTTTTSTAPTTSWSQPTQSSNSGQSDSTALSLFNCTTATLWLHCCVCDYSNFSSLHRFNTFHLEASSSCRSDYVAVHDGGDSLAPLLGKFCGRVLPPNLLSSSNQLFLVFKTDYSVSGVGWRATYEETLGWSCT